MLKRTHKSTTHIGSLMDRYRRVIRAPQGSVVDVFCVVVKRELGITLTKKHVSYNVSTRTLTVSCSGPEKSEILLQKDVCMRHCTEVLGERSAPQHVV